jgi:zinc transport system substrate-binding protein
VRRLLACALVSAAFACGSGEAPDRPADPAPQGTIVVFATSYPLAFFAEQIGGDAVEVVFPVPPRVDPAHWTPDAETIAQAQEAELLLRHGAGDPAWLEMASLHRDRVVDTTAGVRDQLLTQQTALHQHGPEGEHSHGTLAGATWLDPRLAAAQAEALTEALIRQRPASEGAFHINLTSLLRELETLDEEQEQAARALADTPILYSHPVYDYLQARYGLNGRSLVWEPDEAPSKRDWRALRELLEGHPARVMLWEAAPLPETAERLTALGIESRVYAPAANRPAEGDWLDVMHANRDALRALPARPQAPAG